MQRTHIVRNALLTQKDGLSWDNIPCSCREGVFAFKDEYDEHLIPKQILCACGLEFNSKHEWNIHYMDCPKWVKSRIFNMAKTNKVSEFLEKIGEIELKTPKAMIVKITTIINEEGLIEQLNLLDSSATYSINEGKVIVDFVGTARRKQHYRKGKKDTNKVPEEDGLVFSGDNLLPDRFR